MRALEARAIELVRKSGDRRRLRVGMAAAMLAGLAVGLLIDREHAGGAVAAAVLAAAAYRMSR